MKPLVLHYRSPFPLLSETFIRTTVTHHERYRPLLLTHEIPAGEPLPDDILVRVEPYPKGALARLARTRLTSQSIGQRGRAFARAFASIAPDVVHAHFAEEGIAALPSTSSAAVPLVVTFYGFDATALPRHPRWRPRIEALLRRATRVLVEGPHLRDHLLALGGAADRIRVQPIPVALERFPFRAPVSRDAPITVIQACRFVAKKGLDLTLRAFSLATAGTSTRLRLIGDGPDRPLLEELARTLGVADRVEFAGSRTYAEYARDLADADLFIHPSRFGPDGDGEGGAPTALIEAQAVGLPVVSTRHADIPFVTSPAALLAPENDVDAIAAHLRWLLRHPGEWAARADEGRRHVEQQHEVSRLNTRLEELYDEARAVRAGHPA